MTIIPGIGLIILSTSNIMLSLNTEITVLEEREVILKKDIIVAKLKQLKKLSISIVFLYVAILFLLFSSILKSIIQLKSQLLQIFLLILV